MKRTAFIYGGISGFVIILSMIIGTNLAGDDDSMQFSELLGYLIMIAALSLVFVGLKRYRDQELGGVIKFRTALMVGLSITAVASVIYVLAWEVNLALTDYAFIDDYTESILVQSREDGLSGTELRAVEEEMEEMKVQYSNPLFRLPITFLEIFPVGLLISLLSAGLLRNSKFLPAT